MKPNPGDDLRRREVPSGRRRSGGESRPSRVRAVLDRLHIIAICRYCRTQGRSATAGLQMQSIDARQKLGG